MRSSVSPGKPVLTIDYGAATTCAVLTRADGSWLVLPFDGGWWLSSAVHVHAGQVAVGAQAWRQAPSDPAGFVLAPAQIAGPVEVGGVTVETVDLAAATLRQVAAEAARVAGEPVEQAQLLVPAGWGPRRKTWLRHAARSAGLDVARLVEVPIAAAPQLTPAAAADDDRVLLVIDIGAGCEATVLRQNQHGIQVLSTLHDAAAGADRVDALLTTALTGTALEDLPAGRRWDTLAKVRTAQQSLAAQAVVTVPVPGGPGPLVTTHTDLMQAAQPVFERAADVGVQAVTAADLTLADVHAVHLIGGVAALPGAADLVGGKLGVAPQVAAQPELVAVVGAAGCDLAGARADATAEPWRLPPRRRLLTLGVPGLVSLLLYVLFLRQADLYGTQPFGGFRNEVYQVYAAWSQLTVAVVLAQVGLIQAVCVFAALLDQSAQLPGRTGSISRITAGLGIAAVAGPAIAVLYALIATAYFNGGGTRLVDWTMQWAVWPSLLIAGGVALLALATARRRPTPAGGWDEFLSFPASSLTFATAGVVISAYYAIVPLPSWLYGWGPTAVNTGAALIAAAIACALVRHLGIRAAMTVVLAVPAMILANTWWGHRMLGAIYAVAVAVWLGSRLWLLQAGRASTTAR